jgi:hypothetical protein
MIAMGSNPHSINPMITPDRTIKILTSSKQVSYVKVTADDTQTILTDPPLGRRNSICNKYVLNHKEQYLRNSGTKTKRKETPRMI